MTRIARERFRRDAEAREARDGIANAEAAIDQDAGGAGFDDEAVAFAAAAERREAHLSVVACRATSAGP